MNNTPKTKQDKDIDFTRSLMGVINGELKWSGEYQYDWDKDDGTITLTHRYLNDEYDTVEKKTSFKLVITNDAERIVPEHELEESASGVEA